MRADRMTLAVVCKYMVIFSVNEAFQKISAGTDWDDILEICTVRPLSVREYTSSGRKCDVTFLLFLRKYTKIGKNNREKLGLMQKALYQSLGAISGNFE